MAVYDEEDLAALTPAYVAGNSFGASTALGLACRTGSVRRSSATPPLFHALLHEGGTGSPLTAARRAGRSGRPGRKV
ncbi:hypothetical protein GCM10010397_21930 [Streptomyces spinoverrucosus]|nr:hypothetical protein GCM10010397_21930 [Streptomyces spinoverrucosus]